MQKIFSQNISVRHESGLQRVRTQPAFTLVELIVVITIVGILSTIGFVAYSGYLGGARDGNRMASLTKLSDSLQTYAAAKSLPLPDDAINIEASGSLIGYQGYVGENVLEMIDYTNGGKDPKDDSYYTYYLTKDRKKLQLLTFLEEQTAFYNSSLNSSPRNLIPTFSLGGEGASYKENSVASLSSQEREFKGEVLKGKGIQYLDQSQEREFKGEVLKELKREQIASLPLLTGEGIQGGGVKRVGGVQKTKIDSERIQGGGVQRVSFVQKSFASDYSNRYPKTYGQKLGVLISSESATKNTPAQEISANITSGKLDIVTTNSGYTAMIDADESITGTGILIRQSIPNGSCKRIKQLGESKGNGEYTINPGGIGNIQVYCDMETDGGGWTLLMKMQSNNSLFGYDSVYWNNTLGYNESSANLENTDAKFLAFSHLSGRQLKFCIDNAGVKCNTKSYIGTLKDFVQLQTSVQIGYTPSSTVPETNADAWITGFGFNSGYGSLYCNGHHTGDYTLVKIGVNKNDYTFQACNSTDDFIWGFGGKNTSNGTTMGAGFFSTSPGISVSKQGFIFIR